MHISTFLQRQRDLYQESDDEYYSCDEKDKQHFTLLLATSATCSLSPSDTISCPGEESDGPSIQGEEMRAPTLMSAWQMKKTLTDAWLQWRLSNGPLAGMEIAARLYGDEIHIRLQSQELTRLLQLVDSAKQLEQQLSRQFNSHVSVEIVDANTTIK